MGLWTAGDAARRLGSVLALAVLAGCGGEPFEAHVEGSPADEGEPAMVYFAVRGSGWLFLPPTPQQPERACDTRTSACVLTGASLEEPIPILLRTSFGSSLPPRLDLRASEGCHLDTDGYDQISEVEHRAMVRVEEGALCTFDFPTPDAEHLRAVVMLGPWVGLRLWFPDSGEEMGSVNLSPVVRRLELETRAGEAVEIEMLPSFYPGLVPFPLVPHWGGSCFPDWGSPYRARLRPGRGVGPCITGHRDSGRSCGSVTEPVVSFETSDGGPPIPILEDGSYRLELSVYARGLEGSVDVLTSGPAHIQWWVHTPQGVRSLASTGAKIALSESDLACTGTELCELLVRVSDGCGARFGQVEFRSR